jgi:hypothetical protein
MRQVSPPSAAGRHAVTPFPSVNGTSALAAQDLKLDLTTDFFVSERVDLQTFNGVSVCAGKSGGTK